jgi:hypothetical protein
VRFRGDVGSSFARRWGLPVLLILLFWFSRLPSLTILPLHNDEGLHLTRAVEVWNLHPFWEIRDGKVINHWPIAAFFPQHQPVFTGRSATVMIATLGLAAALGLARRLGGSSAQMLAAVFWIFNPYLFFYERLVFSDAEAGALVVVAFWAAWRCAKTGARRHAIVAGLALAGAILFKFTAAPFAIGWLMILFFAETQTVRRRVTLILLASLTAALCFVVPITYLFLQGAGLFDIALGWIGGGGTGSPQGVFGNLSRFATLSLTFGSSWWAPLTLLGWMLALFFLGKMGRLFALAWLIPFAATVIFGRDVLPRHFAASLPLLLTLAGAGIAGFCARLPQPGRTFVLAGTGLVLALTFVLYWQTLISQPERAALPELVIEEHITSHSAGFGLREAVRDLPRLAEEGIPIIASMFPDSCRRANFEAPAGYALLCAPEAGDDAIIRALAESGEIFVLADNAPLIGADVPTITTRIASIAERVAAYPRPGETQETASVVLWRLTER